MGVSDDDLRLMRLIDEIHLKRSFYGSRRIRDNLQDLGHPVNRKKVQRLMRQMGIMALYPKANTGRPDKGHRIYPYLLKGLTIDRPNRVWATDISYIPMAKGFVYVVAIMDWYSRRVLAWWVSNTRDADFCVDVLEEAISRYWAPDIFNTDLEIPGLPMMPSPGFSRRQVFRSAWTARVAGWTICLWSGYGAA